MELSDDYLKGWADGKKETKIAIMKKGSLKKGYFKHSMSWLCYRCIYYKIKEAITGKDCMYYGDVLHAKDGGKK